MSGEYPIPLKEEGFRHVLLGGKVIRGGKYDLAIFKCRIRCPVVCKVILI